MRVTGGSLLFGAGLLHLATWRIDRCTARAHGAVTLVVFGLLIAFTSGLGHVLHTVEAAVMLNPLATAFSAVITMALVLSFRFGGQRHAARPVVHICIAIALAIGFFAALSLLRGAVSVSLEAPGWSFVVVELGVAAGWFATAFLVTRRRSTGEDLGSGAALFLSLGVVWLLRAAAFGELPSWSLVAASLLVVTSIVVITEATTHFSEAAIGEQERFSAAETALEGAAEALMSHDRRQRDLRHDARNAICALRVATQTLSEYGEQLDATSRQELRAAMVLEIANLDQLITRPVQPEQVDFAVGAVLEQVVVDERDRGLDVHLDADHSCAIGSPEDLCRVLRILLINARQHAPGSEVEVTVRATGSRVQLLVEDHGPGVPPQIRGVVFADAVTGDSTPGPHSGLGLHVAVALIRRQGGTIELTDRDGGGALFVLTLPRSTRLTGVEFPRQPRRYSASVVA